MVELLHGRTVHRRRARLLSALLAEHIPGGARVLDVGCGDGMIGYLLRRIKPTLSIQGLEVMPRPSCLIECAGFDTARIPMRDDSVDVCMFVDVLHHTLNIEQLLREARRVARRYILIKDHLCESRFDAAVLRFMDWVGNRAHGVPLSCNYKSRAEWDQIFSSCSLRIASWNDRFHLYPPPFSLMFGRGLHYVGLLEKS
jgi:SAM-dependent methyltransferase